MMAENVSVPMDRRRPHLTDLFGVEQSTRRAMGGHQGATAGVDEWLTPPELVKQLGPFDLDPCAPAVRPWPTAARHYTAADDGLRQKWAGTVWLNPPYSTSASWLRRLGDHGDGIALLFARTETRTFFAEVWERATAVLFIRGRLHFHYVGGRRAPANAGAPSVLVAYGEVAAGRLAGCGLGQFVRLREFYPCKPEPVSEPEQ